MTFRFGCFEIREKSRELLKNGRQVSVQPKVFDLLVYLLKRRDRAVNKAELLEALWPGVHLSETAMTRCVMKARKAVDDSADQQAVIKTIHGHGYRFIAAVGKTSVSDVKRAYPAPPEQVKPPKSIWVAVAGLVIVATALLMTPIPH